MRIKVEKMKELASGAGKKGPWSLYLIESDGEEYKMFGAKWNSDWQVGDQCEIKTEEELYKGETSLRITEGMRIDDGTPRVPRAAKAATGTQGVMEALKRIEEKLDKVLGGVAPVQSATEVVQDLAASMNMPPEPPFPEMF